MSKALQDIYYLKQALDRLMESTGGQFSDLFNEIGFITSTDDPENLGRVQIAFQGEDVGQTGERDWVWVAGSNKGKISSQYIGSQCLVVKANGNTDDAFVVHIFNKEAEGKSIGNPVQLSVFSEQLQSRNPSFDPGLKCNKDNVGRTMVLENEVSNSVLTCIRRTNNQEEGDPGYSWTASNNPKVIEKGFDPGVVESPFTSNLSEKNGLPKCSKTLEGETILFTEDRTFRSMLLGCYRVDDDKYSWKPVASPPVVLRTTLPKCNEATHGVEVVIDPGDNSELAICLRYQGQMKWVHPGSRRPVHFYPGEEPLTRPQFLDSKLDIEQLKDAVETAGVLGKAANQVLDKAASMVSPISPQSLLNSIPEISKLLPKDSSVSKILSEVADVVTSVNSGKSINSIISDLTGLAGDNLGLDDELSKALGDAAGILTRGVESGDITGAVEQIGQKALGEAISSLDPKAGSVYSAYLSGGTQGAIDAATMVGLSQLPSEVSKYVSPVVDLGKDLLNGQPLSINKVLDSALGLAESALPDSVNQIINSVGGLDAIVSGDLLNTITSGNLGEIAGLVGNFANLPGIPQIPGLPGVPQLASSVLGSIGLGGSFTSLLGPAGVGLTAFTALTGINPVSAILGGIPGLGGLFGGGGGLECPCDPKCRKTSHGDDSDGNKLLYPCGNVIKSGHSSYAPKADPISNNSNPITDFLPTGIGEDLCVNNPFDLTSLINSVSRLRDMAKKLEGSKYADYPERFQEQVYTAEATEKAIKQADNNITKIESIERKLLDAQHRTMEQFFSTAKSYFPLALKDMAEHATAIIELYAYIKLLNKGKDGPRYPNIPAITPALLATKQNIKQIPKLSIKSQAKALATITKTLVPAHKEWKEMTPGGKLLKLSDIILGGFNVDVPINFGKCKTDNDKNKVIKESLESKLNSPVPPKPGSLTENFLPNEVIEAQQIPTISGQQTTQGTQGTQAAPGQSTQPSISEILNQISYDQGRAQDGKADCL